jgi:hypothetical protein
VGRLERHRLLKSAAGSGLNFRPRLEPASRAHSAMAPSGTLLKNLQARSAVSALRVEETSVPALGSPSAPGSRSRPSCSPHAPRRSSAVAARDRVVMWGLMPREHSTRGASAASLRRSPRSRHLGNAHLFVMKDSRPGAEVPGVARIFLASRPAQASSSATASTATLVDPVRVAHYDVARCPLRS